MADGEVEAVAVEILDARVGHDAHVDPRVAASETGKTRNEPQGRERVRGGDREAFFPRLGAQSVRGGAHGGEDLRRGRVEGPARVGERERAMAPLEELHAELVLQLLDLPAHRRLGQEELLARLGEGQVARRRLEPHEQIQCRQCIPISHV